MKTQSWVEKEGNEVKRRAGGKDEYVQDTLYEILKNELFFVSELDES